MQETGERRTRVVGCPPVFPDARPIEGSQDLRHELAARTYAEFGYVNGAGTKHVARPQPLRAQVAEPWRRVRDRPLVAGSLVYDGRVQCPLVRRSVQFDVVPLRLPRHLPGQKDGLQYRCLARAVRTRQHRECRSIQTQVAEPLEILEPDPGDHPSTSRAASRTLRNRVRTLRGSPVLPLMDPMKSGSSVIMSRDRWTNALPRSRIAGAS